MAEAGEIRLAVSDDILNEVERVLQRPKFGWTQDQVDDALRGLLLITEHVRPTQRLDVVKDDPTDNRIIECAAASGSEYLVSGDKHLLRLGQYQGVKIVTPADFVEIVAAQGRGR
jgi:putative PIN family toxin of toxin-antitoxin system